MNRDPKSLIMTLEEAVKWRQELRAFGLKLVITNGCFDILHRGHAEYLHRSKAFGDVQLVLINTDASVRALKGPSRPVIDEFSRAYMLAALKSVDVVVMFSAPQCTEEFRQLQPDIYVKGGDYTLETLDQAEKAALLEVGADIRFIKFIDGFSTSDIINKIASTVPHSE
jgi:rfaE bifunctional protein nucleotidyltransferase chain/domain